MLRTIQVQSGASISPRWMLLGLSVSLTVGAKTGRGIVLRRSLSPGHTGTNIAAVEKSRLAGRRFEKEARLTERRASGPSKWAGCSSNAGASDGLILDQHFNQA